LPDVRSLAVLTALLLLPAPASGQEGDETNPRSPGTPLEIVLGPWYCTECVENGTIEDDGREPQLMRMAASKLAATLGLPGDWIAIETPHFSILGTIEKATLKFKESRYAPYDVERLKTIFPGVKGNSQGVTLGPHERLHLYHVRAERVYAHLAALTGNDKPFLGMPNRYEILLFQSYEHHHAYVDRFVGTSNDKGAVQWHFRDAPRMISVSMCADLTESQFGRTDSVLANHFLHNVAHSLIDGSHDYYRETWAWLEEGMGHYYERRESPRFNNFCWAEGAPPAEFQKPDWRTTVLAILRRERDRPFSQWCEKLQPGELDGTEHGLAWGIVEWLIEAEPLRFAKLISLNDDLVANRTCSQAIEEAFGVSSNVLYQRWRDWAEKEYAKR
jgi:hypothetical protein